MHPLQVIALRHIIIKPSIVSLLYIITDLHTGPSIPYFPSIVERGPCGQNTLYENVWTTCGKDSGLLVKDSVYWKMTSHWSYETFVLSIMSLAVRRLHWSYWPFVPTLKHFGPIKKILHTGMYARWPKMVNAARKSMSIRMGLSVNQTYAVIIQNSIKRFDYPGQD